MGFIKPDEPDASDIFVHDSDLRPGTGLLSEGDAVEYGLAIFRGRNKAVDVILVGDGAPAPPSPAPSLRPRGDALDRERVTGAPLSHDEAVAFVTSDDCGAVATFLGVTRDTFEGKRVVRLSYEAYVPMAEAEMLKICAVARARFEAKRCCILHRTGEVAVGEASAPTTVPIWKKEIYAEGDPAWKQNKEWDPKTLGTA
ncbi:molybdopterin synthase [Aureococcus anophagefferens]|nr:molybdopterin synthase [Aureococcus anophagefferens]